MPWKETDRVKERLAFLQEYLQGEAALAKLCRKYGVSRPTGYRWLERFSKEQSAASLADRSSRPHKSPNQTARDVEAKVIRLRKKHGWGARKLSELLLRDYKITLPAPTAHSILVRNGLVENKPESHPSVKRFQRDKPNELWQMDFKGYYQCHDCKVHPLGLIDDASRFCLGLYALGGQTADMVYRRLLEMFIRYGLPDEMLVDHGTPWWSTTGGHGLTWLAVEILKQGVTLRFSGIRHPQTQGKVERLNRTFDEWVSWHGAAAEYRGWGRLCARFRKEYNWVRPHEAISMKVPGEIYKASGRKFLEKPERWEYAVGSLVKRLNSCGCLEYQGRHFVCEALAGEEVKVERLGNQAVVTWRHVVVREIDLLSGRTRALVLPDKTIRHV